MGDRDAVVERREKVLSPAHRGMSAYDDPMILERGEGNYLFDEAGKRYLDCLGQNLCISLGYNHPAVSAAAIAQLEKLQHCTTMYFNREPGLYAEELLATFADAAELDYVVHLVNTGAEAVELALLMARVFTGNTDIVALRNSYHSITPGRWRPPVSTRSASPPRWTPTSCSSTTRICSRGSSDPRPRSMWRRSTGSSRPRPAGGSPA